ncbi:putative tail sheath protein [Vibrio phage 277E43-1]|nr:putative tail sheath protein [Vibrio phage 277E43-1]
MPVYNQKTVDVEVFLQTRPSAAQSFEFPMVIIPHNLTKGVVDSFASLNGVISEGAAINSPVYQFGAGCFGGIAAPDLMKVARATLEHINLQVTSIPDVGEEVSVNCNVNGVAAIVAYEVQDSDTSTEVATGLAAALTAKYVDSNTSNPTFVASGDTIKASLGSVTPYAISFGWASIEEDTVIPHVKVSDITSDVLVDVLTTAIALDDDVSFILAESHDSADVVALANYVATTPYQYFTTTSDINTADNTNTSNISSTLALLKQDDVSLQYSAVADSHFPEAYLVGNMAGINPYNLNNQNLLTFQGVPTDTLTEQQRITLTERNTNYYVTEHGFGTYREGWAMSGNFIDVVRFSKWLKISTELALFNLYKEKSDIGSAVPYNDQGSRMMESRVRNDVVNVGIRGGTVATGTTVDPINGTINLDPVISFGTRAAQTNSNISNRIWDNGLVEVVYISGINHVKVNAYVILNRDPS